MTSCLNKVVWDSKRGSFVAQHLAAGDTYLASFRHGSCNPLSSKLASKTFLALSCFFFEIPASKLACLLSGGAANSALSERESDIT